MTGWLGQGAKAKKAGGFQPIFQPDSPRLFLEAEADAGAPFVDVEALVAVLIELKVFFFTRLGEGGLMLLPGNETVVIHVDRVEIRRRRGSAAVKAAKAD